MSKWCWINRLQRIERQSTNATSNRDLGQIKRVFDHRRNLVRQADPKCCALSRKRIISHAVDRHQDGGKIPVPRGNPPAACHWSSARQSAKGHDRQRHCAHKGIELIGFLVMLTEVIGDCRADVDHRHLIPIKSYQRGSEYAPQTLSPDPAGRGQNPGGIR